MSKQANKTVIGGFVVGAVALAVVGIIIFGSGRFFTRMNKYVLYFEGSVKGLSVGAPVVFRGVKIGSVTDIRLVAVAETLNINIPVFIEIEPDRVKIEPGLAKVFRPDPRKTVKLLIDRGMRARLELQSIVTGQLIVDLDFYPDKPVRLVGTGTVMEIPTIPSGIEQLTKRIETLPLDEIATKLVSALSGIDRVVNSPDVSEATRRINENLKDIQKLLHNVDSRIEPLASSIGETVKETQKLVQTINSRVGPLASNLDETIKDTRKLIRDVNGEVAPLASSVKNTAKAATAAVTTAEKTLSEIRGLTGKDSPLLYKMAKTLDELSAAARSIRVWADYLERHPEALLRGKSGPTGR